MITKELEIRGISRKEIIDYILQLNADKDDKSTYLYKGNGWACTVSEEQSFRMFQSNIPMVEVRFSAENKTILDDIITKFRKKTFRAGG